MVITDKHFEAMVDAAVAAIAPKYKDRLQNVAFLIQADPDEEQRQRLRLRADQTLFGLYEGVPLPQRNGATKLLPDKITLFMNPLLAASASSAQLQENVRHTIWHEVAHYFGLDHERISELDGS